MSLLTGYTSDYASYVALLASTITLFAAPTVAGHYESLESARGPLGQGGVGPNYQVPPGYILCITGVLLPTGSDGLIVLGYGDNAVEDGVVAPLGSVGLTCEIDQVIDGGGTAPPDYVPIMVKVPAGKYPFAYVPIGWVVVPVPVVVRGILLPV